MQLKNSRRNYSASSGASQVRGSSEIIDLEGAVRIPAFTVPFSPFASPEAKKALIDWAKLEPRLVSQHIDTFRENADNLLFKPMLEKHHARYDVNINPCAVGGVCAEIFDPVEGISHENRRRVLINLHGGGFVVGSRITGRIESIPIASIGKIKVISMDYRQGPEHKFPAASEDVATVYREILEQYEPNNIGIYGCSAGGLLTAQAMAWFQKERLPIPGAIGIFAASAERYGIGDSAFMASVLTGSTPLPPEDPGFGMMQPYFEGADPNDPLVTPGMSQEVLARFPATLLIASIRASELSGAAVTHNKLLKAGVASHLQVWDGVRHAFFHDPDLPESRDAYEVMVNFFTANLRRHN